MYSVSRMTQEAPARHFLSAWGRGGIYHDRLIAHFELDIVSSIYVPYVAI